jgi:hypothetical protein
MKTAEKMWEENKNVPIRFFFRGVLYHTAMTDGSTSVEPHTTSCESENTIRSPVSTALPAT